MKIGIDLGTTNSALAFIDPREAEEAEFPPIHIFEIHVRERIGVYKEVGVTYLNITVVGDEPLKIFEQVKSWAE